MAFTLKQLSDAKQSIMDHYNITAADASRVIGLFNTGYDSGREVCSPCPDYIADILRGDLSSVAFALDAMQIKSEKPQKSPEKPHKCKADNIPADDIKTTVKPLNGSLPGSMPVISQSLDDIPNNDIIPAVDGDIISAPTNDNQLPPALPSMVEDWLQEFATKYNIDLQKCAGLQWRAACLFIGQHIQAADILTDKTRPYKVYNPHRVAALIPLYEALTVTYKHVALACDFIAFSGVSHEWFYDSQDRGLSSGRVDLRKKLQAIEESSLSAGLVDSRENPTGRIYYTKARLGWQETAPVSSAPVAVVVSLGDLPALADNKH